MVKLSSPRLNLEFARRNLALSAELCLRFLTPSEFPTALLALPPRLRPILPSLSPIFPTASRDLRVKLGIKKYGITQSRPAIIVIRKLGELPKRILDAKNPAPISAPTTG